MRIPTQEFFSVNKQVGHKDSRMNTVLNSIWNLYVSTYSVQKRELIKYQATISVY